MKITVEHGIQRTNLTAKKLCEVPFQLLGVGDSFSVPCADAAEVVKKSQWMRNQAKKYRGETGHKDFSISIGVEGNSFRVWRIS